MGYTTDFYGSFGLDKPLTDSQYDYLIAFSQMRHTKRDNTKLEDKPDPLRKAVGLPLGIDGEFYVGDLDQEDRSSIKEYNYPPSTQPALYCQWVPDGQEEIAWDGGEKFYGYIEWLEYLLKNFLIPWGYTVNGEVEWKGEESDDLGLICVEDNKITIKKGKIVYE